MSQPSNDAEVENVLSAIRRLIEDGGTGRQAPPPDRLVLTPALRVVEPTAPLVLADAAPAPDLPPAASEPLILVNALPVIPEGAALPTDPEEGRAPEPPLAAPLPAEDPDLADLTSDPGADEAALALASQPLPEGPPVADGPEMADLSSDPGAADALVLGVTLAGEAAASFQAPSPADVVVIAGLVADPGPDEAAGEPARTLDPAGSEAPPAPRPAPDTDLPDPLPATSGPAPSEAPPSASWPDEAALRALVAEVLREELRGELGERLTRNLRKLVRREVMQALALREG